MAKKQRGRQPKQTKSEDFTPIEETQEKNETPTATEENKETEKVVVKHKSKIVNAELPNTTEVDTEVLEMPKRRSGEFRVYVRGKERMLSRDAILVASKDKSLHLEIPEDTDFDLPNVRRCKDC